MKPKSRLPKAPKPIDAVMLRDLALAYVGRFATTRANLARYLMRKLRERGWAGDDAAEPKAIVEALVEQLASLGYIDDAAFAGMKARALGRRGFGARRIGQSLWQAGVNDADRVDAEQTMAQDRVASALRLAQRRHWGPYAAETVSDPRQFERMFAAFLRAGHDARLARQILRLAPGSDVGELDADD